MNTGTKKATTKGPWPGKEKEFEEAMRYDWANRQLNFTSQYLTCKSPSAVTFPMTL